MYDFLISVFSLISHEIKGSFTFRVVYVCMEQSIQPAAFVLGFADDICTSETTKQQDVRNSYG
jgi:hypothetical protein